MGAGRIQLPPKTLRCGPDLPRRFIQDKPCHGTGWTLPIAGATLRPMNRRFTYTPMQTGRIAITNPWHEVIAYMDCSGNAQQAYEDLCRDFERAGWEMERRVFDSRYMRRGWIRWSISINSRPVHVESHFPGFMAAMVEDRKRKEP